MEVTVRIIKTFRTGMAAKASEDAAGCNRRGDWMHQDVIVAANTH